MSKKYTMKNGIAVEVSDEIYKILKKSDRRIKTVSELLGHSNVNITLNRYVHSSMEMKKKCVDKLNLAA